MFDLFSPFSHSERSLLEKSSLLWWIFCQTSWKTLNTTKYTCIVRGIYFKIHAKLKAWLLVFHITSTNSIRNVKAFLKSKMCNFIRMKEDEKQKIILFIETWRHFCRHLWSTHWSGFSTHPWDPRTTSWGSTKIGNEKIRWSGLRWLHRSGIHLKLFVSCHDY